MLIPLLTGLLFAADAGTGRALDLYNHADYADAIAILGHEAPDARNLELLGQCYFFLGDFKSALGALEKAAAISPSDSMIRTWLGRAWGGRAATAFAFQAFGYARKAREAFENAVRLDPSNRFALSDLFDFYIEAPRVLGGGLQKAQDLIPRMERYDAVGARLAQARVDEANKQFDKAEAQFREAIRLGSGSGKDDKVILLLDLAQFLARRGRYGESDKTFDEAAAVAPDSPRVLFARAETDIPAGRNLQHARDLLKKYLAAKNLTPEDPPRWEALRLLGRAGGN